MSSELNDSNTTELSITPPKKHINLSLDPYIFAKLKEKKDKSNSKSWEDFIIVALLQLSEHDLHHIRLQQAKDEINDTFYHIETLSPEHKYEFELIRTLSLYLLHNNQDKALIIVQQLLDHLKQG